MLYRRELCNLEDNEEGKICLRVAALSLKNSDWTLVSGLHSNYYFDLDSYAFDNKTNTKELISLLGSRVTALSEMMRFDKIAFIDKEGPGPVGLITFFAALNALFKQECIIIRPRRQLLSAAIKGPFKEGDSVLILNDVATEGSTIFEAAEKIWECGGTVPCALVILDRSQGATTNLGRKGIELYSLTSAASIKESKPAEFKEISGREIEVEPRPRLTDFGGPAYVAFG